MKIRRQKRKLDCALRYMVTESGQRVCLGAEMGRRNWLPDYSSADPKLYLERLKFVDVCYDQGGAYWGAPANVWRAVSSNLDSLIEVFVRADSRSVAKHKVRKLIRHARFYR